MTLVSLALIALAASPVKLEPAALTFGPQPEAAIVLTAPNAKTLTVVSANGVGSFSAAESLGEGRFRVRFTFPKERFPQLALLRVEREGGAREWAALPLLANADLKIETKPNATVTVTIGEKTFGPAVAGAKGKVTIPAQVPPGFATATVLAVDRAGNRTTQPLDLSPPPFARVAGALAGADASPDQPATLELFAVEPDGKPLAKVGALKVTAKLGTCEAPTARGDGVFLVKYRAPAKISVGVADQLTLGVEGSPATTPLEVPLRAGAPARLAVTLSPPSYTAGSKLLSRVQVNAVDVGGNVLGVVKPQLTTDFGTIEATADGLLLRVPDRFEGKSHAKVTATANDIRGEASLALVASAPVRVELTFPSPIAAGEAGVGTLFVADEFGNPVTGATLAVTVTTGRAAVLIDLGGGHYEVKLDTGPTDPPGAHELTVTANGQSVARVGLAVLPNQRRWAVSVSAMGFVESNFSQWLSGGPRVSLGLRVGGTGLEILAEGVFATYLPILAGGTDGGGDFTVGLQSFGGMLGARYWVPIGIRPSLHFSVAGGLAVTSSTVGRGKVVLSDATLAPLARAAVGLGVQLGFGKALLQIEYTFAPTVGLVRGNAGGFGAGLGYLASF